LFTKRLRNSTRWIKEKAFLGGQMEDIVPGVPEIEASTHKFLGYFSIASFESVK
jgi:hypothetical protein